MRGSKWSNGFMFALGLCVVMSGLLTSGCSQGGSDTIAFAAGPPNIPTQPVEVTNTASNPVPIVDAEVKQPFAAQAVSTGPAVVLATVPPGKRLVIETMTANTQADVGGYAWPIVTIQTSNVQVSHILAVVPSGPIGTKILGSASSAVRLYADPSSSVELNCGVSGNQFCRVTISGHLVDVPS